MPQAPEIRVTQPPIEDYAIIGDCHGAALVSSDGSIDWCALTRMDEDPVFFRILDAGAGGSWSVQVEGTGRVSRSYLPRTNVLRTTFDTATGTLELMDFMPVGRKRTASVHDYVSLSAPGWLVRRFKCISGQVEVTTRFAPRGAEFSTGPIRMEVRDGHIACAGGLGLWCGGERTLGEDGASIRFHLSEGECESCVLVRIAPLFDPRERSDEMLATTSAFWSEWCEYSRYRGPYSAAVERSALVLKLLTYAPTGGIVAAPTVGLPEEIGGGRNWDYRYCWIRDATYALYALSAIGFSGEGARFSEFLSRRCLRSGTTMRIMYGLDGNPFLPEHVIDHLAGHRDSRPVRVGNEAAEQRQLDVFGEVLDWAELRAALGARPDADEAAQFAAIADHVCRTWEQPDQGLWEVRSGPRHFTFGKAMAWVTLDRAARLLGDRPIWRENRELIMQAIRERGCAGDPPYIAGHFGSETTDAAVLQIPLLGLPLEAALLERTVARIEHDLRRGDFVYRYRDEDGLAGEEGAFVMTSFWLVEALLATGRAGEARDLFEQMLARANDVGLYAEEIDPATGGFLGNFPQAYTHIALITSAQLLHLHDLKGRPGLKGTNAERARRLVGATEGWRALAYALLRNRSIRIRSSRRSVLRLD